MSAEVAEWVVVKLVKACRCKLPDADQVRESCIDLNTVIRCKCGRLHRWVKAKPREFPWGLARQTEGEWLALPGLEEEPDAGEKALGGLAVRLMGARLVAMDAGAQALVDTEGNDIACAWATVNTARLNVELGGNSLIPAQVSGGPSWFLCIDKPLGNVIDARTGVMMQGWRLKAVGMCREAIARLSADEMTPVDPAKQVAS